MKTDKDKLQEYYDELEEIRRAQIDNERTPMYEYWELDDRALDLEILISEIEKRL